MKKFAFGGFLFSGKALFLTGFKGFLGKTMGTAPGSMS
jgi:hypothetical protein